MRADSHINEKSIWRFLNGLLLSCIGLFGGGRLLGIDGVKPAHFLTVITVLVLFTFLNNASARGRVMALLLNPIFHGFGAVFHGGRNGRPDMRGCR